MADIDRLVQLVLDISTDDFFFTVNIEPIRRNVWVYKFTNNEVVDYRYYDLSDIKKARKWIKKQHKKHVRGE